LLTFFVDGFDLEGFVGDFFSFVGFAFTFLSSSCLWASFKIFSASPLEISFLFGLAFSLIKFKIFSS